MALERSSGYTNNIFATGIYSFIDINFGISYFGYFIRMLNTKFGHDLPYHIRKRPAVFYIIAGNHTINLISPLKTIKYQACNIFRKACIKPYPDTGFAEFRKRLLNVGQG